MSTNSKLSNAAAAACAGDGTNKGLLPLLAAGVMTFYDGAQPTNPDTAVGAVNNYGSVTLPNPAGTESNGVLTLGTIANGSVAYSGGPPTWFRICTSGGAPLWDGSCGNGAGYDCNVGSAAWVSGGVITGPTGGTLTIPAH